MPNVLRIGDASRCNKLRWWIFMLNLQIGKKVIIFKKWNNILSCVVECYDQQQHNHRSAQNSGDHRSAAE